MAGCLVILSAAGPGLDLSGREGVHVFPVCECERFQQHVRQISPNVLLLIGSDEYCPQLIGQFREAVRWGYVVAIKSDSLTPDSDLNEQIDEVWHTDDVEIVYARIKVLGQIAEQNHRWQMIPQEATEPAIEGGRLTLLSEGRLLSPARAATKLLTTTALTRSKAASLFSAQESERRVHAPLSICGVPFPWRLSPAARQWQTAEVACAYQVEVEGGIGWQGLDTLFSECISQEYHLQLERMRNQILQQKADHLNSQFSRHGRLAVAGELAAGIAHEIRNPLAAVRGFIQLLRQRLVHGNLSTEIRYADYVLEEIDRANQILNDFLAMARPSKEEKLTMDLGSLLAQQVQLVRHQAVLKGIELAVELPEDLPAIQGRAEAIKQVFLNLMSNALQATAEGGTVGLFCRLLPGEVQIDVRDSGCGIQPDQIENIFEPFYTTKSEGTGLGLSICREIVNDHGGSIDVVSELGIGSTFSVRLPVKGDALDLDGYDSTDGTTAQPK